jgi:hypothetical protein
VIELSCVKGVGANGIQRVDIYRTAFNGDD